MQWLVNRGAPTIGAKLYGKPEEKLRTEGRQMFNH